MSFLDASISQLLADLRVAILSEGLKLRQKSS
jgi:hypothetical protein